MRTRLFHISVPVDTCPAFSVGFMSGFSKANQALCCGRTRQSCQLRSLKLDIDGTCWSLGTAVQSWQHASSIEEVRVRSKWTVLKLHARLLDNCREATAPPLNAEQRAARPPASRTQASWQSFREIVSSIQQAFSGGLLLIPLLRESVHCLS